MSENSPRIFVCYSRVDAHIVNSDLFPRLQKIFGEKKVWNDQSLHRQAGIPWQEKIYTEVEQCDVVVFFISNESLKSRFCQDECEHAYLLNKSIIPAVVTPKTTEPIWEWLWPSSMQCIDFSDYVAKWGVIDERDFDALVESIWHAYRRRTVLVAEDTSGGEIPDLSVSIPEVDVIRNKILSENTQVCLDGLNDLTNALGSELGYPPISTWHEKRKQAAENLFIDSKLYPAEVELLLGFVYCENDAIAQKALDLLIEIDIFYYEPDDMLLLSVIRHISSKFRHHMSRFITYLLSTPQVYFTRRQGIIKILIAEKILNPNAEANTPEYDLITFFLTGEISPASDSAFNDITSTQPIHSTEPQ